MISAIILLNCRFPFDMKIMGKLDQVPSVTHVYRTSGRYDLILKITADTEAALRRTVSADINTINNVDSALTMIIADVGNEKFPYHA